MCFVVRMMEEVGFEDLDIAWRQEGFFVAGGRKPEDFSNNENQ